MTDAQIQLMRRMLKLAIIGAEAEGLHMEDLDGAFDLTDLARSFRAVMDGGMRLSKETDEIFDELRREFADDFLAIASGIEDEMMVASRPMGGVQ